jgi:peptidoglycan LD-endopeptidase LytH
LPLHSIVDHHHQQQQQYHHHRRRARRMRHSTKDPIQHYTSRHCYSKTAFLYTPPKVAPMRHQPLRSGGWLLLSLSLSLSFSLSSLPWNIVPFTTKSHFSSSCLALALPHQSSSSSNHNHNHNNIASRDDSDSNNDHDDDAANPNDHSEPQQEEKVQSSSSIDFLSPFGSYPNPLQLTEQDRATFHPVIKYPQAIMKRYSTSSSRSSSEEETSVVTMMVPVNDYRFKSGSLATEQERKFRHQTRLFRHWKRSIQQLGRRFRTYWRRRLMCKNNTTENDNDEYNNNYDYHYSDKDLDCFRLGRYDENRIALYSSELFQDVSNQIDGYSGARTVHLGIDLGAPAHTPIYTFDTGIVHSIGYNPALGDYGHVIVIQYNATTTGTPYWALYGHLDRASTTMTTTTTATTNNNKKTTRIRHHPLRPGQVVQKGDIIGWIGNVEDNGGWYAPHLHFQLSIQEPTTHDMPGAVSVADRDRALIQYPDPRYVLGPLYNE